MKRLALLIAAGTLLSGAARADATFDGFRDFCLAHRGDAAAALAAADAAGWLAVPPAQLAQLPQTDFQNPQGRMHPTDDGGAALLLTARGVMAAADNLPVRVCVIGAVPAGASDLAGQLQSFAGVPKQTADGLPEGFYAWRDENGQHVPVDRSAPDFRAQVASGAAMVATTRSTPQMTMILLMSGAQ